MNNDEQWNPWHSRIEKLERDLYNTYARLAESERRLAETERSIGLLERRIGYLHDKVYGREEL